MSLQALHASATGMEAYQFKLDNIANNLANAGTTAFKRQRVNFEDLYYQQFKAPGAPNTNGDRTPTGIAVGLGSRVQSTAVDYNQGSLLPTEQPYDIAIQGGGFFQVSGSDGLLYTRSGNFGVNDAGQLVLQSAEQGRLLEPPITIPDTAIQVNISQSGDVTILEAGSPVEQNVGTIQLAQFRNPQGLIQRGENLYAESSASGTAIVGPPALDGRGELLQGFLEASNVEPVRELVDLIKTQRNFELNSQVIQAADQTLQLVANLRRF